MASAARPVAVKAHGLLEPPSDGLVLVSAAITVHQEVVALWSSEGGRADLLAARSVPSGAPPPVSIAGEPAQAIVTLHGDEARVVSHIPELPVAHAFVDVLPAGRVLVVGGSAQWRPSGPEQNARVYDERGVVLAEGLLGDGVHRVQTTSEGAIWVGYSDEGVYGNYGWGGPGPAPIGRSGLATFDANLQQTWTFSSPADAAWLRIDDCYALNVSDDAAWACYYSEFPIVRIQGGRVAAWSNETTGASALVVAGARAGLVGGYQPHRDRLVIGRLGEGVFSEERTRRLVLPGGEPLPAGARIYGRGASLHVLDGKRWFRLDPLG
jgi:hypothetical protein